MSERQISSSVFPETQHGIRGLCEVVHDRAGFFEKNIFAPKRGIGAKKWTKNRFF